MNISELLDLMKNDISSLTTGQLFLGGAVVALLAMVVVFIILILIAFFIKLLQREPKKKEAEIKVQQEQASTISNDIQPKEENVEELVSVITAAIAASRGDSANNIIVKRIIRTNNIQGNWQSMTVLDTIE
jgi:sodium pump decarboxylase gamma subunit